MHNGGGGSTSSGGANSYGRHGFTVDEIEVSGILVSLPHLIHLSESRYRFSVQWGTKRKRSVIDSDPPPTSNRLVLPSPLPEIPQKKVHASSPATPLSYQPSESDDKPRDPVKKISKRKTTREELKDTVDELEKERQSLKRKLETQRARRNQLVAYNAALKAKQLELTLGFRFPVTETTEVVMEKQENYGTGHVDDHHKLRRNGLVWPSFVGPRGIPDLNLTLGDVSQPSDRVIDLRDSRVKSAAEARRIRKLRMKNKMKNSSVSIKISSRC